MARVFKIRTKKVGLPPGTLVHVGEERTEPVRITILDYDQDQLQEFCVTSIDQCLDFKAKPSTTWMDVVGVHRPEVIEKIGDCFNIHPLVLEDILNTEQRPKMEDYDDYVFIVLRMLASVETAGDDEEIRSEQVSLIVGRSFVVSFQETEGDVFDSVRDRIRKSKGKIRRKGADYLAYALIDAIVDNYFLILEGVGEDLEALEDELVTKPTSDTSQQIHDMKRDMIFLRKSVWPLREVISRLSRGESEIFEESTAIYLRDVYDHTVQVIEAIETFRDILSGMLEIYLSSISNRMNEVMKVLTIIATIFIPLTLVAGIYGMNFEYMPELRWRWGYPAVLLFMLVAGLVMLLYFRRKGWL
ncbi:magnesium/cobalt transporter CorA [Methanocrinis sp.]|uniref:magnesium/cobalt transporter CorA n=1 Tax=Methanocrinis sp. TaxID=3101522 RepID=UPI003D14F92E